ncbi:MAG: hypothetical protein F6K50_01725 [Moorea sp. SIO3I7]|uniref:hypothetical protein n=1 Tax=unclassified Moorena TaxID=2683338 RepID=UPI0013C1D163|nr:MULTISPECIES: hypothetical protein [unclassified Moorena]NEN94299.1 hypothetical protein [Moorena sp. SIO3I7]NEO04240.1 hypothetical protein [Moorena sp. SIO3I8]NEO19269.1 hypothetical protein [Moorena sp. SIO4A5]NEP20890.1 hypothetical protein [Moorena sp. SIO3I6]NEQ56973.1 hypothetical protein [Moorena sp. SIO4A1]
MKSNFPKTLSMQLSMAVLTMVSYQLSATAETPSHNSSVKQLTQTAAAVRPQQLAATSTITVDPDRFNPETKQTPKNIFRPTNLPSDNLNTITDHRANSRLGQLDRIGAAVRASKSVGSPSALVNRSQFNASVAPIADYTVRQEQLPLANLEANLETIQYRADLSKQELEAIIEESQTPSQQLNNPVVASPRPGTLATSVAALKIQLDPATSDTSPATSYEVGTPVAQRNIDPTGNSLGVGNYIGIGGHIGFTDDGTNIGRGGFMINGKYDLSPTLSVRPSILINDDATFVIPATYNFIFQDEPFEPPTYSAFAGGGLAFSTGDDNNVGLIVTGGVDWPFGPNFVANAALTTGIFVDGAADVGISFGIGYSFSNFGR